MHGVNNPVLNWRAASRAVVPVLTGVNGSEAASSAITEADSRHLLCASIVP